MLWNLWLELIHLLFLVSEQSNVALSATKKEDSMLSNTLVFHYLDGNYLK